ncbi:hypothetical protein ACNFIA_16750 [Pseudomonas sp. NY15437]|uniref:hypothetical protein n=1 Tax=Pseudomonas sp. NY15437 TaxID=3400360 RepID=UPI003A8A5079
MNKVSSLLLAATLCVASTAHATDRLQIQAVFSKDGQVLSTQTQEVGPGETAHFSKTEPKEFDVSASGNSKGIKVEKEIRNLGFTADVTARVLSTGDVKLFVKGLYTEAQTPNEVKTLGVKLKLPNVRSYTLGRDVIVDEDGKASFGTDGDKDPKLQLDVTVKRL